MAIIISLIVFAIIFGAIALALSPPGMNANAGHEIISDEEKAWNDEQIKEQHEYFEKHKNDMR